MFLGFEHDYEQKNSSKPMDKLAKIWSQSVKYNVFCRTEAIGIISSVNQYRIIMIVTLIVPRWSLSIKINGEKIITLFSYYNVVEMGLKLEESEIFTA